MSLIETISTLAQAGFTKDDILRFAGMQPTTPVAPQAAPVAPVAPVAPQAAPVALVAPQAAPVAPVAPQAAPVAPAAPQAALDLTSAIQELYRQGAQIDIPAPPQKDAYQTLSEALTGYYAASGTGQPTN